MKREIKFRGKHIIHNAWCYGSYLSPYRKNNTPYIWGYEDYFYHCGYASHEVAEETVGQYTGLKDKNGIYIYEGDIMNDPTSENVGVVEWNSVLAQFQLSWQNMPVAADIFFMAKNGSVVIGNIHDNPELISKEDHP